MSRGILWTTSGYTKAPTYTAKTGKHSRLLCPLLTSPRYSAPVSRHPASIFRSTGEISRGKTRYLHCIDAGFTKCTLLPQMEDFAVTCPLVPSASRLISGFCSSPRSFGLGFLQTPPRGDALALLLAFGSAKPGHRTFTDEVTRHARRTRKGTRSTSRRTIRDCSSGNSESQTSFTFCSA